MIKNLLSSCFIFIICIMAESIIFSMDKPPEDPHFPNDKQEKPYDQSPYPAVRKRLFTENEEHAISVEEYNEREHTLQTTRAVHQIMASRRAGENERRHNKKKDKENITPDSKARPTHLKGIFTRNLPKLEKQVGSIGTPTRRSTVLGEAQQMTPLLTALYRDAFKSQDPEHPTPIKTTKQHTRSRSKKLSKEEIERLAEENLPPTGYHVVEQVEDYGPIYQNDQLIDLFRQDEHGRINLQRMLEGEPPVGPDTPSSGRPEAINLHHLVQGVDPGPLAELSATLHRRETAVLHRGAPGIDDRNDFDNFRRLYWQARVYDLLESNHQGIGLQQD